jgi:hypothetical protein
LDTRLAMSIGSAGGLLCTGDPSRSLSAGDLGFANARSKEGEVVVSVTYPDLGFSGAGVDLGEIVVLVTFPRTGVGVNRGGAVTGGGRGEVVGIVRLGSTVAHVPQAAHHQRLQILR